MYLGKAQSILEYAVLMAVIVASLIVMQVFIKRGASGRLKGASDQLGGGESFSSGETTILADVDMTIPQVSHSETATRGSGSLASQAWQGMTGRPAINVSVPSQGLAYTATTRSGGDTIATTKTRTSSASQENLTWAGHSTAQAPEKRPADTFNHDGIYNIWWGRQEILD